MSVVNYKGYGLLLNKLSENELKLLKNDLTVVPLVNDNFTEPEEIRVFRTNSTRIYIPKYFGLRRYLNEKVKISEREGLDVDFRFSGKLRDDQIFFIEKLYEEIERSGACVGCSGTGSGKTVMAINMIALFKKKTLIIVHKEFLMNQWKDRIKQFIPDARVGIIQQNKIELDNDICIGMIHSISMKDYDNSIFDEFGFIVLDEVHHICSKTFSNIMFKVSTKRMLGLSATPTRKDGLSVLLEWYLNRIITKESLSSNVSKPYVKFIEADYDGEISVKYIKNKRGDQQVNVANLITQLCLDNKRNDQIVREVERIMNETTRSVIILSDRLSQCNELNDKLLKKGIDSALYVGNMKQEDLDYSCKSRVLVATYALASEGFDLPKLDTLIMASGRSDIVQTVGRITRRKNENVPLIIDIVDKKYRYNQFRQRLQYYKNNEFYLPELKTKKDKKNEVINKNYEEELKLNCRKYGKQNEEGQEDQEEEEKNEKVKIDKNIFLEDE